MQAGKVRWGYFSMAFLGPESQWAAEASECAADQGRFWDYHDLLYTRQKGENQGTFSKENLKGFAGELGLDVEAFAACLDSGKYAPQVQADTAFARSLGISGTPAFLVNGRPVMGAQPFETFQTLIEAEPSNRP